MIIITKHNIKQSERGERGIHPSAHMFTAENSAKCQDRLKDSAFSMPGEKGGVNEGLGEAAHGRER